jgi:membrane associated rhomboid family serine protease
MLEVGDCLVDEFSHSLLQSQHETKEEDYDPIRDQIPTRRVPVINYLLIAANILVFVLQWISGSEQEAFVYQFALIPANFTSSLDLGDITDIFTSMFMHAGLAHIAGNMLYLWIFGDNVEDSMGAVKYLAFYLLGGLVASLTHILTSPGSQPHRRCQWCHRRRLGCLSGAFPKPRLTIIPLGFFMRMTMVPAGIVLGLWFVLQLFSGVLSLGGPDVGGVAFWAHIGGFVTGVVLAKLLAGKRQQQYAVRW